MSVALVSLTIVAACGKDTPTPPEGDEVSGDVNGKVIYGDDDRRELHEETDANLRALADSTVVLLEDTAVGPVVNGWREIKGTTFKQQYKLCPEEPFASQIAAGFCSGFLVSSDTVVTAGHCVRDANACAATFFAFGYAYAAKDSDPRRVAASDVYKCKQIVRREENSGSADFAVIQLDRTVANHKPVPLRKTGAVKPGEKLVVMGYPSGLPLKIADGANVRSADHPAFFVANLDTYGGNSGSAVFNLGTRVVEGILVRGEQDFVLDSRGCMRSNRCANDACRGEDVTKITEAVPFIPALRAKKPRRK